MQRQFGGRDEGDDHGHRRQRRGAQHQHDVGPAARDEFDADDEDQPADHRHRDQFGERSGDQDEQRHPDACEDARPPRLRTRRHRHAGAGQRSTRRQRAEEAAREVRRALRDEVPRRVGPAAVGVGHRRRDARRLRQATSATAKPAAEQAGDGARNSVMTKGGNAFGIDAMSPTVSTSTCSTSTAAVTTTSAISVANAFSGLMKWNDRPDRDRRERRPGMAPSCHDPTLAKASTNLPNRVVALRSVPGRVEDHARDDLHGDAGGEAGHHRVGDEVHDRAELAAARRAASPRRRRARAPRRSPGRPGLAPRPSARCATTAPSALVSVVTISTVLAKTEPRIVDTMPEYRPATGLNPPMLA